LLSIDSSERLFDVAPLSFEEAHEAMLAGTPRSALLDVEVTLSGGSEHSSATSANVIGLVRGTDPELAGEYVVYTAHLDHLGVYEDDESDDSVYNGMYDNAMGVALMLETARVIASAPPRRSVLFVALTAEESGLIGSDFFVNNPVVPADSLVANINLDMPLFLYPLADVVAFGSQHSSLQLIAEAGAGEEGFVFSPDPMPEENLFVRSDQYSFVRGGVPAIFLVPGFNSTDDDVDGEALFRDHLKNHYHKPSDDLSRPVHWDSAVRFARAHTRMGFRIGNDAARPAWNEGDFFGEQFGRDR
jgi:Zn-dependent M28 family amino/carboxypeptidase